MNRKGFPESYDVQALLQLLHDIKAGKHSLRAPVYSHHHYDIVPNEFIMIDRPDIVIIEGLNILQTRVPKGNKPPSIFVSDYFDFTIFVDAELDSIQKWFVDRVIHFYNTVFRKPDSYFHHLTDLMPDEVSKFAQHVWHEINEVNLFENILPYKQRAQLILHKNADHAVDQVMLRKL